MRPCNIRLGECATFRHSFSLSLLSHRRHRLKAARSSPTTIEPNREQAPKQRPVIPLRTSNQRTAHFKPHQEKPPKRSQAEKRIAFVLNKYFNDDPDFRPLILKLAELDPTPKKKYLAWLVKYWVSNWNPTDADLACVTKHLETHYKGAKYFSPLSWTGLRLEDAGYHADVFRYRPETLASLGGKLAEIIRIDDEDKQIRKGNLVVTRGAEVAYKDKRWTLLRVRTNEALRRLGQGTLWCVRDGNSLGYRFPFDFLLNEEGERFLANDDEIRDRWDRTPTGRTLIEIHRVRALGSDGYDRASLQVADAMRTRQRLDADIERLVLQYPDLAIRYAEKVIGGKWEEFEKAVRVATLSAQHATNYAIRCRGKRWPRFENKIKRSVTPLAVYRNAFPGSIPKSDEDIFQDKLAQWRIHTARASRPRKRWSIQWQAESRERNIDFEDNLLLKYSEASVTRYARLIASLATSEIAPEYRAKIESYFMETKDKRKLIVNEELGGMICKRIRHRVPEIESLIADNSERAFAYAFGISQRFLEGERAVKRDPNLWLQYTDKFLRASPPPQPRRRDWTRILPPNTYKTAWR